MSWSEGVRTKYIGKPIDNHQITEVDVKIEKLYPDAQVPTKGTELRAYYDVYSYEDYDLVPEKVFMARTGIKVQAPVGWFIDVRPRSGLAKLGITINNSPGTVDCDYGEELLVELVWHEPEHAYIPFKGYEGYEMQFLHYDRKEYSRQHLIRFYHIKKGDRIAQIGVMPMYLINFIESEIKGTKGFGSTGR